MESGCAYSLAIAMLEIYILQHCYFFVILSFSQMLFLLRTFIYCSPPCTKLRLYMRSVHAIHDYRHMIPVSFEFCIFYHFSIKRQGGHLFSTDFVSYLSDFMIYYLSKFCILQTSKEWFVFFFWGGWKWQGNK